MSARPPPLQPRAVISGGEDARAWRCGQGQRIRRMLPPHSTVLPNRRARVTLSTCHLDHDPTNNGVTIPQRCTSSATC